MRKICKNSLGRLLTFAPNLAACSNHLEHCCLLMFNGCAVSILIQSRRNWRSLLGDSIPMLHSTRVKLCIHFSKDTISGPARLCSNLKNSDFCATDANEMWYWCVLVNKESLFFFTENSVYWNWPCHTTEIAKPVHHGKFCLQLNTQLAGILGA